MAYTHEPALSRRLPSADVHQTTHIHPSHLVSSLWLRDDALQSHPASSHVQPSAAAAYSWQTSPASDASSSQVRDSWNTLPQAYSLAFADTVSSQYIPNAAQFDPDYPSAIISDAYPATSSQAHSRPSSSSSHHSHIDPPRLATASWDSDLYRFDPDPQQEQDEDEVNHLPPHALELAVSEASRPGSPRVKQEEGVSDDFVFERPVGFGRAMPAFAPMTEVPLRATGASKEMRVLMGVFRLDPFAINNTTRSENANTDWSGDEIGPLAESPKMFEFQLEDLDAVKPEASLVRETHSVSPVPSSLSYPEQDDDRDMWDSSSQPVLSSPSIMSEPISYETVITPAQSLGYTMRYDTTPSSDSGAYSSSPPTSLRMPAPLSYLPSKDHRMPYAQKETYSRLPYSTASPLRLPLPTPSSRYLSVAAVQDADSYADESDGMWYRKNTGISLAMFDSKDSDSSLLPSTTSSTALSHPGSHLTSMVSTKRPTVGAAAHFTPWQTHLHPHHQLTERATVSLRYS